MAKKILEFIFVTANYKVCCSLLFKRALLYKWHWRFDSKKDFEVESFNGKVWGIVGV